MERETDGASGRNGPGRVDSKADAAVATGLIDRDDCQFNNGRGCGLNGNDGLHGNGGNVYTIDDHCR
jgi:hypothetical protein